MTPVDVITWASVLFFIITLTGVLAIVVYAVIFSMKDEDDGGTA